MSKTLMFHLFVTPETKTRNTQQLHSTSVTQVTNIFLHRTLATLNVEDVHGGKEF